MQVQPVVVAAPGAADPVGAVDHQRVDAVPLQGGGDRKAPGSGSDDDHFDASHAAKATHPGWIAGAIGGPVRENGLCDVTRHPVRQ